jgi:hypothetical protein
MVLPMPSLRACVAGVAVYLSLAAERAELDCFVAALLALMGLTSILTPVRIK